MQTENKLIDDFSKLASSAVGALHSLKGEIEAAVRSRVERKLAGLDLVGRDEFEAVRAMAAKAREENEVLKERLAAMEGQKTPKTPRNRAAKKPVTPKK